MVETLPAPSSRWAGVGRWLSFAVAAILLTGATVVMIVGHMETFSVRVQAALGWDVIIGLVIFGAVISGHRSAPALLIFVSIIFALRAVLALTQHMPTPVVVLDILLTAMACGAAVDLRRQKAIGAKMNVAL